jgi:dihydrolipoamide dehydrogenase
MRDLRSFDLSVIGGGPGGYVAAIRAAQLGLRVCLIEKSEIGGVCLNWGCIPTKALLKSAEVYNLCRRAGEFGVNAGDCSFDMAAAVKRSRQVSESVRRGVEYLLKQNEVPVFTGGGRFVGPREVAVTGPAGEDLGRIEADSLIVATGARQKPLPGVEIDGERVITSTEAMGLSRVPTSMLIVGAGAVGVEFAHFFNSVGCKVTLLEMLPSVLPGEDEEITRLLTRLLKRQGIDIVTSALVQGVEVGDDGIKVEVSDAPGGAGAGGSGVGRDGGQPAKAPKETERGGRNRGVGDATSRRDQGGHSGKIFEAAVALIAIGVVPNSDDLGLERAGVELTKGGFIKVDEYMRTTAEGVYAIGDVCGPPLLAHVASAQGIIAVEKIAGKAPGPFQAELMPRCVYCQPQVASVGLTEKQAIELGYKVKVGRFPFRASGKSVAIGERDGMAKVVADSENGRLLGAAIIGSEATELIAEPALAQNLDGGCRRLLETVHAHPTLSEAVMEAAGDAFGVAIHKPADVLGGGKR